MQDSFTGQLLVASSLVTDPVFSGGVVLTVHHDEEQIVGVMLNRPMKPAPQAMLQMWQQSADGSDRGGEFPSDDDSAATGYDDAIDAVPPAIEGRLVDDLEEFSLPTSDPTLEPLLSAAVHFGGPLSGPVVAVHQTTSFAEAVMAKGLYVAAQRDHLEQLIRADKQPYRLIVGHLRWEIAQLQAEIESGLWHPTPATAEMVFAPSGRMWHQLIRRATSASMSRWIGVPDVLGAGELN